MIKILDSKVEYWAETKEYVLEINGDKHSFTAFDSSHEKPYWIFDGIRYDNDSESVAMGITIADIMSWLF
jgi:hypothetical protein